MQIVKILYRKCAFPWEKKVSNFNIASPSCNDPALVSRCRLLHNSEAVYKRVFDLWLMVLKANGILSSMKVT